MKKLSLLVVAIIAFVACKKNDKQASTNSPSNTGVTITPITRASFYNGIFSFIQGQTVLSTHPLTYSYSTTASVTFRTGDSLHYKDVIVNSVMVDSVATNLTIQTDTFYASPSSFAGISNSWKIVGAGIIPSFSYTSNKLPNVISTLPDTIDHTKPLSLFVQLNSGNLLDVFVGGATLFSSTGADSATFHFTAANFSNFTSGTTTTIQVESQAGDQISVNGLPMSFYLKRIFVKPVYIK